jgi:hypothetical protein
MAEQSLKKIASAVIKAQTFMVDDEHPIPFDERPKVSSFAELVSMIESDPKAEVDARVLAVHPETGKLGVRRLDRSAFLREAKDSSRAEKALSRLREADAFATDGDLSPGVGLVGEDFIPLLGGPFFKQLYQQEFTRACSAAFYAWNHDPFAHQALNIKRDFTLGRGFRVDCENQAALALWRAFEKANDLQRQMWQFALELSLYGESMFWKLPNNNAKIIQRPYPGQKIPKALIPRVRLVDPTVMWDIITDPEDITSVLFYVWLAPTQYQVFSGLEKGKSVPSSKFIFQQIPGDQILHYKVNAVSNEKRGRSDLFPALGYLKRLRDSINYEIIRQQKQSAYGIDTTIRGSQADIDAYISDQQALGTIAPAGSEFVHTDAVERKFMAPEGGKGGASSAFEWCMSAVASAMNIPISYFGTHLSGGQTRASAIVATEPVAKSFEMRQGIYERVIHDLWDYCMEWAGIDAECEVTFPDIITQDRSAKLKDLALAQSQGWISRRTAALIASKEMGDSTYEWETEKEEMDQEGTEKAPGLLSPLTAEPQKPSGLPSSERREIKRQNV